VVVTCFIDMATASHAKPILSTSEGIKGLDRLHSEANRPGWAANKIVPKMHIHRTSNYKKSKICNKCSFSLNYFFSVAYVLSLVHDGYFVILD